MSQKAKPWSTEQVALLHERAPQAAQASHWLEIAAACGHSIGSCRTTWVSLRAHLADGKPIEVFGKGSRKNPKRLWSEQDNAELFQLRTVHHKGFFEIDKLMERARGASGTKFRQLFGTTREDEAALPATKPIHAAPHVPQHTSLTAAFCGDPLPGRSALDRINAGLVEPPAYLGTAIRYHMKVTLATEPMR